MSKATNCLDAMREVISTHDRTIYIGLQGFSNLSGLVDRYPELIPRLGVYQMAGSLGYSRAPGWTEHNVRIDVESSRRALASGGDLTLIMAQTTHKPEYQLLPGHPIMVKLRNSHDSVHRLLWQNVWLFHQYLESKHVAVPWGSLHDSLTVSAAISREFIEFEPRRISINELGACVDDPHGSVVNVSKLQSKAKEFIEFLGSRL